MQRYSWERISRINKIPFWIQQISLWRKCSTYLQNWWANKKRSSMWIRFSGKNIHGNICLQRAKVYVFSDSVFCLGRDHQHPQSNEARKDRIGWIITDESYRDYDGINGEPCGKVTDVLSRLGETPETFTGRILIMSMFNDISCDLKGKWRRMCGKWWSRLHTCKEVWYRTVVIYWSRFR